MYLLTLSINYVLTGIKRHIKYRIVPCNVNADYPDVEVKRDERLFLADLCEILVQPSSLLFYH